MWYLIFVANRDMSIWRQQAKWKFGYTTQANKAKVSLFNTVWKAWYREREREAVESGTPCQCDPLKDTLTLLTPHVYKDPWKYNAWPNQNETVSLSLSLSLSGLCTVEGNAVWFETIHLELYSNSFWMISDQASFPPTQRYKRSS